MAKQPNIGIIPIPEHFKYEQVIRRGKPVHNGDYFSIRHPLMDPGRRAKIFAPFAALKGFEEEVRSKEVPYETKREPDADELYELNETLVTLQKLTHRRKDVRLCPVHAEAVYFEECMDSHHDAFRKQGLILTVSGVVQSVDPITQTLKIHDLTIPFSDIYSLTIIDPPEGKPSESGSSD